MLIRFFGCFGSIAILVFCLAAAAVPATSGQPGRANHEPATAATGDQQLEQSYIGTDRCYSCHRSQSDSWSETKHALAFENLPENYRQDSSCLECHATGLGKTGGYVLGMPDDEAKPLLNVGCEVCHGPGALHEDAVKRWTLADPAEEEELLKQIKTNIVRMPTDSQCAVCHKAQAHQVHPAWEGQPAPSATVRGPVNPTTAVAVVMPPSAESYSVKTCGSCHYPQYQQWRNGAHAGLTAKIPANYQNDAKCLECHRENADSSRWYTATTDPSADVAQAGVACESCHGSGLKHVMFNKQHINALQPGPELEQTARQLMRQGKPESTCLQCHILERHGDHPKFEVPETAAAKQAQQ